MREPRCSRRWIGSRPDPTIRASSRSGASRRRSTRMRRSCPASERTADGTSDPDLLRSLGFAAHTVGDFARSADLLGRAARTLREQGRLALLAQALVARAWDRIHLGLFPESARDADEGWRLAAETEQRIWTAGATIARALHAGVRGDESGAEALALEAEAVVLPAGLSDLLSVIQLARGITSLTAGRHSDAFDHLARMFDPGDVAFNQLELFAGVTYLAESAVHSGRQAEASAIVERLESVGARTAAPSLHAGIRFARAVLASDRAAEPLFRDALARDPGWPFDAARLRLAYGSWLRRRRRITESRPHLRGARDIFQSLAVFPWADRASLELRAAGERVPARSMAVSPALSPQELEIAQLAAEGLSNREIGERLFLSHRTIGSHLYRIFPKLGVASRADLAEALDRADMVLGLGSLRRP